MYRNIVTFYCGLSKQILSSTANLFPHPSTLHISRPVLFVFTKSLEAFIRTFPPFNGTASFYTETNNIYQCLDLNRTLKERALVDAIYRRLEQLQFFFQN